MIGGGGGERMDGGRGADRIYGGLVDDEMFGGPGDDLLVGGHGVDAMHGGDGDDWMRGDTNRDIHYGDGGQDTVSYATATPPGPRRHRGRQRQPRQPRRGSEDEPQLVIVGDYKPAEPLYSTESVVGSNYDDVLTGNGAGHRPGPGGRGALLGIPGARTAAAGRRRTSRSTPSRSTRGCWCAAAPARRQTRSASA